ncbi:hypothetical protein [Parapedobacter sp. 2B3]|uniref:hypothetical protein n=1 Tax=Parapedobacter sp. 2B3 TaxID=3342381 RepID=UPI0035B5E2AE
MSLNFFLMDALLVGGALSDTLSGAPPATGENYWWIAERVLAAIAAVVGIISGVIVLWRRENNRKAKHRTSSTVAIENLSGLMDDNPVYTFNETGGDPSHKARVKTAVKKGNETGNYFVLSGIPGSGKSFLAQQVAYEYAKEKGVFGKRTFDIIWWVDAEDLSRKNTAPEPNQNSDLLLLAKSLGIEVDQTQTSWLDATVRALGDYNYLLVFDNACEETYATEKHIRDFRNTFFPPTNRKPFQRIVVTSRNKLWRNVLLDLPPWTVDEFRNYLTSVFTAEQRDAFALDDQSLSTLYEELARLPLAASLAAAFMVTHGHSTTSYAELASVQHRYRNGMPINKAFGISYAALEADDFRDGLRLLHIISFLAPTEMPLDEFQSGQTVLNLRKAIAQLSNQYAFIKSEAGGQYYHMHRLWQQTTHALLHEKGNWDTEFIEALTLLRHAVNDFKDERRPFYRAILPHIEVLASHWKDSLGQATQPHLTDLLKSAAAYSFKIGEVSQAMRLYDQVIAISPDDLLLVHEIGMKNSHNLILRDHCDEAMALAQRAFDYFSTTYQGPEKIRLTEEARQRMGKVHQRRGDYRDATQCFQISAQHILKSADEKLKNKVYPGILHDLGSVLWEEGIDYDKSISYFDSAVTYQRKLVNLPETEQEQFVNFGISLSLLIKGVVEGLQGKFAAQQETHLLALAQFTREDEHRRRFYIAYYLLHFARDRQMLGLITDTNEIDTLDAQFNTIAQAAASACKGDVKSTIINAVVALRNAVSSGQRADAKACYATLLKLFKRNGTRYLDDGTVSVSAVLDYALLLENKVKNQATTEAMETLQAVVAQANAMLVAYPDDPEGTKGRIGYHRTAEVERLYEQYLS